MIEDITELYQKSKEHIVHTIPTDTVRSIYFMGIKGVGMTALAIIAREAGFEVRGCDVEQTFITDSSLQALSIPVDVGFETEHIQQFMEGIQPYEGLVITTGAHKGFHNPVCQWASANGYPVITQGQAVGLFMDGRIFKRESQHGISVAGSHGKTTISAMFATVLQKLGEDPSYVVGTGQVYPLGYPGHFGTGHIFVAEADEYASDIVSDPTPKLFHQKPSIAVVNNIDFDHPDFYQDINQIEDVFSTFLKNLPGESVVVANGDDVRLREIVHSLTDREVILYGSEPHNDFQIRNFKQSPTQSEFDVFQKDTLFGTFTLKVPGIHNALNSLPVIVVCKRLGYDSSKITEALSQFSGSKRRSEILGTTQSGALIIDDYAHHPKEIETTLRSLTDAYPQQNIVCVFQPHTQSRTKALLQEFAESLQYADEIVLLPVFASARETAVQEDSGALLFERLQQIEKPVKFFSTKDDVIKYITQNHNRESTVIVTMGAGDVYTIGAHLTSKS